jgi:hypothetical protein
MSSERLRESSHAPSLPAMVSSLCRDGPETQHSQTTATRQPSFMSVALVIASLSRLLWIFAFQNFLFVPGRLNAGHS